MGPFTSIFTRGVDVELPDWYGQELYDAEIAKAGVGGRPVKYIKRVPTGNPRRPWRYFYRVTGVADAKHMIVGARVEHGTGHYEVTGEHDDGTITVKHDATGKEKRLSREAFARHLLEHHGAAVKEEAAKTKAKRSEVGKRAVASAGEAARVANEAAVKVAAEKAKTDKETRERREHTEVGEHVWGSRKDTAQSTLTVASLSDMSAKEAYKAVTKDKVLPDFNVDLHRANGGTPGGAHMAEWVMKTVASRPEDTPEARAAYLDGCDFLAKSLTACRTYEDVESMRHEIDNIASGYKIGSEVFPTREAAKASVGTRVERDELKWNKETRAYENTGKRRVTWSLPGDVNILAVPGGDGFRVSAMHAAGKYVRARGWGGRAELEPTAQNMLDLQSSSAVGGRIIALGPRFYKWITRGGTESYDAARAEARKLDAKGWPPEGETAESGGVADSATRRARFNWTQEAAGKPERVGGPEGVTSPDVQKLADEFKFRNVQFGQWASDEDRAHHVMAAHNALRDLSSILGSTPAQVTLNGRLAIGFGARGNGNARAHYEPTNKIINITKFAGGGTLAHEWSHFLDGLMAEVHQKSETGKVAHASELGTHLPPDLHAAFEGVMGAIRHGPTMEGIPTPSQVAESRAKVDAAWKTIHQRSDYMESHRVQQMARDHAALEAKAKKAPRSTFYSHAIAINGKTSAKAEESGKEGYWTRPTEMMARAFEAYVQDKLEDNGRRNSYLVDGTRRLYRTEKFASKQDALENKHAQPYPQGEERKAINAKFDTLLTVLREGKHLEKALSALATPDRIEKGTSTMITWELPEAEGAAMWAQQDDEIRKGLSHRYIERRPTGNPKRPYRYFYNVRKNIGDHRHFVEGAKFQTQGGHHEITHADGERITVRHDETGEEKTMTRAELAQHLEKHHGAALKANAAKLNASRVAQGKKAAQEASAAAGKANEAARVKKESATPPKGPVEQARDKLKETAERIMAEMKASDVPASLTGTVEDYMPPEGAYSNRYRTAEDLEEMRTAIEGAWHDAKSAWAKRKPKTKREPGARRAQPTTPAKPETPGASQEPNEYRTSLWTPEKLATAISDRRDTKSPMGNIRVVRVRDDRAMLSMPDGTSKTGTHQELVAHLNQKLAEHYGLKPQSPRPAKPETPMDRPKLTVIDPAEVKARAATAKAKSEGRSPPEENDDPRPAPYVDTLGFRDIEPDDISVGSSRGGDVVVHVKTPVGTATEIAIGPDTTIAQIKSRIEGMMKRASHPVEREAFRRAIKAALEARNKRFGTETAGYDSQRVDIEALLPPAGVDPDHVRRAKSPEVKKSTPTATLQKGPLSSLLRNR